MGVCAWNILFLIWACFTFTDMIYGNDCSCNCKYEITEDKCKTNDCEGITCQNNGTCQDKTNGYMCICQEGFSGISCQNDIGGYVLYRSFDTLDNLVLMDETGEARFPALVAGQVYYAVSTDRPQRQWIDLGIHTEACMTKPETCGDNGGSVSLWYRVISCTAEGGIITSRTTSSSTGFGIDCTRSTQLSQKTETFVLRSQRKHNEVRADSPSDWVHVVFNYNGDDDEIKIFQNGVEVDHDISRTVGTQPTPGDGRIVIGRRFTGSGSDSEYASVQMDEFLMFNKTLTENEIRNLNQ